MNPAHAGCDESADAALRRRIGDQVRLFRRLKHVSQVELARMIGMRPGPLNAIEQGRHVPTGRVLLRLADALGASVDDLLGRGWTEAQLSGEQSVYLADETDHIRPYAQPIRLRDDRPLPPADEKRVDALAREFLALEDECGAQKSATIPLRHPFRPDDRGIELLAQQVRQFLGIGHGVIFDYLELFENAGLRVICCALPADVPSVAYYDGVNANAFFFINEDQSVERQLFELAKRLGAIYLHTGGARPPNPPSDESFDTLRIARKFAAFFLMPEPAMRTTVAQTGITPDRWSYELVQRLKHRFGVSAESFIIRLEELALITELLANKLKTRIRREYKKTGHQEPDGSRRILTPNGRLNDLRLVAGRMGR